MKPHRPLLGNFFERFVRTEAFSGILLFIAAVIGFTLANSGLGGSYFEIKYTYYGAAPLKLTLEHWVNDGLMALFFLLVGLEIKRELKIGELANLRSASLAIFAAAGGMIVPALLYAALNVGGAGGRGWGIPMATDIAFALGVLALLGSRVPLALKVFLTALAIVDDLGAVLVIALFYTSSLDWGALALAGATWAVALTLGARGEKRLWIYGILGVILWYFTLKSGLHATIAGVLLALAVPLDPSDRPDDDLEHTDSPLHRLEHLLHPYVSYGILPLFALVNSGVATGGSSAFNPVTLGVIVGLMLGKPLGVVGLSLLAVRLGLAELPARVTWGAMLGVGCLAGIGFTMALFITGLAFDAGPVQDQAKTGILIASILSAVLGTLLLRRVYSR